jgi:hypothetical protein
VATVRNPQRKRGAVSIPAADGYHYADDHPWDAEDQDELTEVLWKSVEHFKQEPEEAS